MSDVRQDAEPERRPGWGWKRHLIGISGGTIVVVAALVVSLVVIGKPRGNSPAGSALTAAEQQQQLAGEPASPPPMPFSLVRHQSRRATLGQELGGRPAVVNFFASWCSPCKEEMSLLVSAADRAGSRVTFVGIDTNDNRPKAEALLEADHVAYPALYDSTGQLAVDYNLANLPTTLFLAPGGRVIGRHDGALTRSVLSSWVSTLESLPQGGGVATGTTSAGPAPPRPGPAAGIVQDRAVPDVPLVGEDGKPTSLGAYKGKVVVMADFLTSCQEVCPITNFAFQQMRRAVDAAGLGSEVAFVEVSVDPERDTPARLRAYAAYTGTKFPLLTGTPADLDRLWKFFGVYHHRQAEGKPPGIDWETGKPYTYDLAHSDALILLGPKGHERFATLGIPNVGGHLPPRLASMLDARGRQNLANPQGGWTVDQALGDLGWLLHRSIPPVH